MSISWGYSPKIEKYIPLADFPANKYLIIAKQAIENLGWNLSHLSETGIIAYTPISFQSYSEEISIRIHGNFAVVKSECVGIQMWFNDYGKNDANLGKFFHEFEYIEFHLKDVWNERLTEFHQLIATQDDTYFEKAPLATKNKIKNVLYLFYPQKGYFATPIIVILNILYFAAIVVFSTLYLRYIWLAGPRSANSVSFMEEARRIALNFGVNNRNLVLEGQFWRLISHQFIHGSISHLFFNMYALIYLGLMIENKLGWKNFVFIYLLSGICGGLISLSFHQESIMMGASGAIMGLYGAFIALLLNKAYEKRATKSLLISTLIVALLVLINGAFGKRVDNAAHIGGFVSGFIFCYLLTFKLKKSIEFKVSVRYGLVTILFLIFFGGMLHFSPKYQTEEFYKLKDEYSENLLAFNRIMSLSASLGKEQQLQFINENGIIPSKKNLEVVKKMQVLTLNDKETLDRELKTKIARKSYEASMLMYKDIQSGNSQYRKQVTNQMNELIELTYKVRDSLSKID